MVETCQGGQALEGCSYGLDFDDILRIYSHQAFTMLYIQITYSKVTVCNY